MEEEKIREIQEKESEANKWVARGFYFTFGAGLAILIYATVAWLIITYFLKG